MSSSQGRLESAGAPRAATLCWPSMPIASEIHATTTPLAHQGSTRSEATLQSDMRQLLLTAPFAPKEHHLGAALGLAVGHGHRIDVEIGLAVSEVNKDLRSSGVLQAAVTGASRRSWRRPPRTWRSCKTSKFTGCGVPCRRDERIRTSSSQIDK